MTLSTPFIVYLGIVATFLTLSWLMQRFLKRPSNLPGNLAMWIGVLGVVFASFLGDWLPIERQWSTVIGLSALLMVLLLVQLLLPRQKA